MRHFLALIVLSFLSGSAAQSAQQRPSADQVMAAAKAAAVEQRKDIFLVFSASWCQPCREMEDFLKDRKIRPILDRYFVIASLNILEQHGKHPELESPGAEKLAAGFGGGSQGVPFLVFLDEQGHALINSNRPVKGQPEGSNVGYPAAPEEIDWFMTMLRKTLPDLTEPQASTIESWLRRNSGH